MAYGPISVPNLTNADFTAHISMNMSTRADPWRSTYIVLPWFQLPATDFQYLLLSCCCEHTHWKEQLTGEMVNLVGSFRKHLPSQWGRHGGQHCWGHRKLILSLDQEEYGSIQGCQTQRTRHQWSLFSSRPNFREVLQRPTSWGTGSKRGEGALTTFQTTVLILIVDQIMDS